MSASQEVVLSSVEQYCSEVSCLPIRTRSEERELVRRARSGDREAKEALLQGCLRYVAFVASRYACYMEHDAYLVQDQAACCVRGSTCSQPKWSHTRWMTS